MSALFVFHEVIECEKIFSFIRFSFQSFTGEYRCDIKENLRQSCAGQLVHQPPSKIEITQVVHVFEWKKIFFWSKYTTLRKWSELHNIGINYVHRFHTKRVHLGLDHWTEFILLSSWEKTFFSHQRTFQEKKALSKNFSEGLWKSFSYL